VETCAHSNHTDAALHSLVKFFVFVAVMQPPVATPLEMNPYKVRKYTSVHGRGNRTGL